MESADTLASQDRRRQSEALVLLLAIAAGIALRLLFVFRFPAITPDGRLYLSIAATWRQSGVYGTNPSSPSFLRMPGYPAFLAGIDLLFGSIRPTTVYLIQSLVDLATGLVVGLLAAALFGRRAGKTAFVLAMLCPFTANYVALVLTETLAIFTTALALLFGIHAFQRLEKNLPIRSLVLLGAATGAGILIRPDAGILLPVFGVAFLARARQAGLKRAISAAAIMGAVTLACLVPWTVRNAVRFGRFQPLAPVIVVGKGERAPVGFSRWVSTWIVDYVSDQDVWWKAFSHEPIDPLTLPRRAFGSDGDPTRTLALIAQFNETRTVDEALDLKFNELAAERIRAHPLSYYIVIPMGRMADMWLRPRTEMLPLESRWWEFQNARNSWLSIAYAGLNFAFLGFAVHGAGINRRRKEVWILLAFAFVRTALIATVGNPFSPEERYTLEAYPAVLALAAEGLRRFRSLPI